MWLFQGLGDPVADRLNQLCTHASYSPDLAGSKLCVVRLRGCTIDRIVSKRTTNILVISHRLSVLGAHLPKHKVVIDENARVLLSL
jgi:hypothetical protein